MLAFCPLPAALVSFCVSWVFALLGEKSKAIHIKLSLIDENRLPLLMLMISYLFPNRYSTYKMILSQPNYEICSTDQRKCCNLNKAQNRAFIWHLEYSILMILEYKGSVHVI
jgi:hypothetical protein